MKKIYLVTLLCALLGISQAWADEAKISGEALGNEVKSWQGNHVTFTLSTTAAYSTDWGNSHLDLTANSEHTISWAVDPCYKIQVTGLNYRIGNSSIQTAKFYINNVEVGSSGLSTGKNMSYSELSLGNDASMVFKSSRAIDLYYFEVVYTVTPNTYSVAFHADEATSGEMNNQAFTYDAAQNLSANAFARSYTVNFDAADGDIEEVEAVSDYTFAGWATQANGEVVYTDGQNVNNLTTIDNAVVDLYAVWNGAAVTLPETSLDGMLFDGWYNGEDFVGMIGDSFVPTEDVQLVAHWAEKRTPIFALDKSEIELEQTAQLTFTNSENPVVEILPEGIVSYDAQTGVLTALAVGEVTISISQSETATIAQKAEEFVLNVTKKTANLAAVLDEVEQNVIILNPTQKATVAFNTNSDGEIEVSLVSGGESAVYTNGEVEALNQEGTAAFSAVLAETETFKAASLEFYIVVARAAEATDCYVLENQSDEQTALYGNTCHEHTWSEENSAGVVKFQVSHNAVSVDPGYKVQQLVNGEWQDATEKRTDFSSSYSWKSVELNPAAKGVRFWGSGTLNNYFKNISVSRKGSISASADSIQTYPNETGAGVLQVIYSIANGGDLKIVCDNEKFVLDNYTIESADCNSGIANIGVSYEATQVGEDTAHVVIYNGVYSTEVLLTVLISAQPDAAPSYGWYEAVLCPGDSVEFEGVWYFEPIEEAIEVVLAEKNMLGGDSIVNLTISLYSAEPVEFNDEFFVGDTLVLEPGVWYLVDEVEGNTLIEESENVLEQVVSFDITATFRSVDGCDSVIIRHINVQEKPTTPTGWDGVQGEIRCTKLLREGVLYIRRGENLFTIEGRKVK